MWPFSEMSLAAATLLGTIANWGLLGCLVGGVLSTFVIVKTTDVKEHHWDLAREHAAGNIAELLLQGDQLRKDTADANARAAEATLKAEREHSARLAILTKLEPRTLDQEQYAALVAAARGKIRKLWVYAIPFDRESERFAWVLTVAFREAGVETEIVPLPIPVLSMQELMVYGPSDRKAIFDALSAAKLTIWSAGRSFPDASTGILNEPAVVVGPKSPPLARQELPEIGRRPPPDVPWRP